MTRPGSPAKAAAIVATWMKADEEILDKDDPRGVVTRNTVNGDITIVGSRVEDTAGLDRFPSLDWWNPVEKS